MAKRPMITRTRKTKGLIGVGMGLRALGLRHPATNRYRGVKRNEMYMFDAGRSDLRGYTRTLEAAKKKGAAQAQANGETEFYVQNQITGSILNYKVNPAASLGTRFVNAKVRMTGGRLHIHILGGRA